MNALLQKQFLGNSLRDYIISLVIIVIAFFVIRLIKKKLLSKLKKIAANTPVKFDEYMLDVFDRTILPLFYFIVFYLGINNLILSPAVRRYINLAGVLFITIYGIKFFLAVINYAIRSYWLRTTKDMSKENSLKGILKVINIIVWALGIVFLLDNLGFKISAVIAGLGIGGIAVALAAQAVLGDLFSYFAIFFDRPFEVGDFIIVGDYLGVVEYVGIKTTRIRSLGGEQIVFSNTDLTNSRVRNYKRMAQRRVVFTFGVLYETPIEALKEIPGMVKEIITAIPETTFDRAHFFKYGDSSLIYEVVYYVLTGDYNKYMDVQQKINFKLNEEFKKKNIGFAYPTRTLYINNLPKS